MTDAILFIAIIFVAGWSTGILTAIWIKRWLLAEDRRWIQSRQNKGPS